MVIKKKQPNCYYSTFFSSFKNCLLKKNNNFICYYSKFNLSICYYFYKNNFFSELYIISIKGTKFLYVLLNINKGNYLFNHFNNKYKKSKPINMTVKKLKKLNRYGKLNYLLSTSKGILSVEECILLNIGGLLLLEYY